VSAKKTQGLVFFGARSEFYPSIPCYGIVITARCDFAQKKVKLVHYVTAVPMAEWIKNDCALMIGEEIGENAQKNVKKHMERLGLNSDLSSDLGPSKCERVLLSYEASGKYRELISKEIRKWNLGNQMKDGTLSQLEINNLLINDPEFSGKKKEKVNLIVSHKMSGYYYLPSIDLSLGSDGLVANFRDIRSIRIDIFDLMLSKRLDCLDKSILHNEELKNIFVLNESKDFAIDVGIIVSPVLEHFMQSFALLFTRIGVEDVTSDEKNRIYDCCLV
jgi:hypothetical protein